MKINKKQIGYFNGEEVYEHTLTNSNQVSFSILSYGGIITSIQMPDREGRVEEVTVNVEKFDEIVETRPRHGALVGPVAGRIAKGRYFDGDEEIVLEKNEGENTLHSGGQGLDNKNWTVETRENKDYAQLILRTTLPDGESGFPGNVQVKVTYTLTELNEMIIGYEATTDKKTLFNPTNHVYFNLSGDSKRSIYQHQLYLDSDYYGVLDKEKLPTGELRKVTGSDFDFRKMTCLTLLRNTEEEEIKGIEGLDHPFVLNKNQKEVKAKLYDEESGRLLEVKTDSDAIVVYTHNHEQVTASQKIEQHSGITLETSILPDAVNQENFGSVWLEENKPFKSQTTFIFSIQ